MNHKVALLAAISFSLSLVTQNSDKCFAKTKAKEKNTVIPRCTSAGEIQCPKGFKPNCPEQYKPSCIFVMPKQLPACLADSADKTFYSYSLDKISCKKDK
ncbi:MAG: hypothetical protein HY094_00340 [Candidatus Melainabacteria bacterium]|nr:hypothetical protein [Candidatus Melainabacteria bacterium]